MKKNNQTIPIHLQPQHLPDERAAWLAALESGDVLHLPTLPFELDKKEREMLDPIHASKGRKNISLAPAATALKGIDPQSRAHTPLHGLVARYARAARDWVETLLPQYSMHLTAAATSLRLHQIETRPSSWRKDDSRLHVDAFPSRPNHGERILRVFMNINPHGEPRIWRIGETFEAVAQHFLSQLPPFYPSQAWLMHILGITKRRRSHYDHIMLGLHDAMKADMLYQQTCSQESVAFIPGAGWICFSDQTSHAAMSGQFMLEQTFFLKPQNMADPQQSPLSILERLTGRQLV